MKTGHLIAQAGFGLVGSAVQDGKPPHRCCRRPRQPTTERKDEAAKLLDWGFKNRTLRIEDLR